MTPEKPPNSSPTVSNIEPRLKGETLEVARQLRSINLMKRQTRRWLIASAIGAVFVAISFFVPGASQFLIVFMLALVTGVLFLNRREAGRTPFDHAAAALMIEKTHPSLQQSLSTAIEQGEDRLDFLQRKLIDEVLVHPSRSEWYKVGQNRRKQARSRNLIATLPLWLLLLASVFLETPSGSTLTLPGSYQRVPLSIAVSPGDTEAERGSTVVITARFEGEALPKEISLIALYADGTRLASPMGQSLSDPVFVHSIQKIDSNLRYQVEYDGQESDYYQVEIFDLPALLQADATLDFPEYTNWPDRFIEDTRRISAVEGSELSYSFTTNKPLESATLVEPDGVTLPLTAANPERTRFEATFTIAESKRYALHLADDKGRTNPFPPDIRIEALPNKRPELKIEFPKGDQRVSPIEEVALEAAASDDFGLVDYGLAYSIGAEPPVYLSKQSQTENTLESVFEEMLSLEEQSVEVDDLLSWFAWADDYGPDGSTRRSTSDLYFAEVRSLDEIFRENESGGGEGPPPGQGEQDEELIETQRQIAIATWKLQQRGQKDSNFLEDAKVIQEAQQETRAKLEELKAKLEEEREIEAAELAGNLMDRVSKNLDTVIEDQSDDSLGAAWSAGQGATQALLRMQPKEFNVSKSSQPGGGGGGGQSRNQRQLNQLDFRQEENRYETASQAQSMTSPEQKEQLQVLSKLSELARRQQDMNERLQELQTAIAAAKDEEERDKIRRELKRLEEEQRQMLADVDETRQQMDRLQSNESNRESRERLDQARDEMRQLNEELERGEVSQALATGSRAQENLEELREEFRNETSSQFGEQLRDARKIARELADKQRAISKALDDIDQNQGRRLDNSGERDTIVEDLQTQQAELDNFLEQLREVTEASEFSEHRLHRELYDVLRKQSQSDIDQQLQSSSDMLSQGFVEQTQDLQPGIQKALDELQRNVEQAANSVLGDEASMLRFAQNELDDLSNDLQANREGSETGAQGEPGSEQGGRSGNSETPNEDPQDSLASGNQPGQQPGAGDQPGQSPGGSGQPSDSEQQANSGQPGGSGQQPASESLAQQPGQGQGQQPGQGQGQGEQPGQGQGQGQQPGQGQGQGSGSEVAQSPGQSQSPGSGQGGSNGGGGGAEGLATSLDDFLREFSESQNGTGQSPITGRGFGEWSERLRTVEELVDQPDIRQRLSQAREQAERIRAEFKRHGAEPQWGVIDEGIIAPLNDARTWVRQELVRHENPNALQPIDRDPVPRAYQESVRKYYESLGE